MIVRKSTLRRRAEGRTDERSGRSRRSTLLGERTLAVLRGVGDGEIRDRGELDDLVMPHLLASEAGREPETGRLLDQLELAFLGRASAGELDAELDGMPAGPSPWVSEHFADDLFLGELVRSCLTIGVGRRRITGHRAFLARVLACPPADLDEVRFRQGILAELEARPELAVAVEALFGRIASLLELLRASRDDARLEPLRFRLEVLQTFRQAVCDMVDGFADASSGLHRLSVWGAELRASQAFRRLEALLDHEAGMATLRLGAVLGSDGRIRHLEIQGLAELRRNPFYRRPLRRWLDRMRIAYHRYSLDGRELADRLVMSVFQEVLPAMARVVQLLCHLEVYLASRSLAAEARGRGLEVCLPELEEGTRLEAEGLFNPLLLAITRRPVPSDLEVSSSPSVTLVTGPNSGGKTRLLQAVGIAQVLGQSGLYAPCARARLPLAPGLFASIVELDRADQAEGRLGTELMRLRTLFESVPPGSVVLLDELCSGTNPSEAIEIVDTVLRLLHRLGPVAFVTTHFLDFARQLCGAVPSDGLAFLQAEVDGDRGPTYRFVPGVATTSLAVGTARRLGVTFEELERRLLDRVTPSSDDVTS